ncbi:MAG: hypothetical protein RLZZ203_244 [Cyanobacteriota bacterium]
MLLQSQKQQSIKLVLFGLGIGLFIPFVSIFSSIIFALNSYLVIAPKFDEAGYFQKGLAKVKIGDKYGYIDKTGAVVVPFKSEVVPFKSEEADSIKLRPAKVGAEYGYVDKTGNTVIPPQFSGASNFNEGLASVNIDDKWGYIDKTGKIVIPLQFNKVGNFHEGLAGVEIDYKWGYIDKTGKIVVPPEFETEYELKAEYDERKAKFKEAESLKEGLKPVKMGRKYGYIRNPLK